MKKKVLFVVTSLGTGGIIRALQNFLNSYDSTQLDVDVFPMVYQGVYCGELHNCRIIPQHLLLDASLAQFEKKRGWAKVICFITKLIDKISGYRFQQLLFKKVANRLLLNNNYDAVIGFSEGVPTLFVSKMCHPNKTGWIHCDYSNYLQLNGIKTELNTYKKLQHIVCVSDYTCHAFSLIYPTLAYKTSYIYNVLDDKMMRIKATDPIEECYNKELFNIVSVGRIDPVKRLSIVPELARKIIDSGGKIRWYVVGPKGTQEEYDQLYSNIENFRVEDIVYPLGEKINPYPYIANADLLVNTSISEACPYVINEAKILRIPVVCTDFGSAKEFIEYGINGFYEPIEKVADRIIWLIKHPKEHEFIKDNLRKFDYDNNEILNRIYSLL